MWYRYMIYVCVSYIMFCVPSRKLSATSKVVHTPQVVHFPTAPHSLSPIWTCLSMDHVHISKSVANVHEACCFLKTSLLASEGFTPLAVSSFRASLIFKVNSCSSVYPERINMMFLDTTCSKWLTGPTLWATRLLNQRLSRPDTGTLVQSPNCCYLIGNEKLPRGNWLRQKWFRGHVTFWGSVFKISVQVYIYIF